MEVKKRAKVNFHIRRENAGFGTLSGKGHRGDRTPRNLCRLNRNELSASYRFHGGPSTSSQSFLVHKNLSCGSQNSKGSLNAVFVSVFSDLPRIKMCFNTEFSRKVKKKARFISHGNLNLGSQTKDTSDFWI